ncbi:hypothetical protein KFU94_52575 [Chloroflexi bacterium TSY]|nr:hypothetical protein [Chloroflexi bacterium TSY]
MSAPICYDLSNFLVQFPPRDRQPILDFYQQASEWHGQQWPSVEVWNVLFDTVECARLANSIIWPALAAGEDQAAEWAFDELMQIEEWFAALGPVL